MAQSSSQREQKILKALGENWQAEMRGFHTYNTLAERDDDAVRSKTLRHMAEAEAQHAAMWAKRIRELGAELPKYDGKPTGDADTLVIRLGGPQMALRRLEIDESRDIEEPEPVRRVAKKAATASWKSLAAEDLEDTNPTLPIGKCFWPLSRQEKRDIERLVADREMHRLATRLRSRDDNEEVKLVDAAYWVKGCSSLGRLRYAVLLHVDGNEEDYCLVDLKEAVKASAPHAKRAKMPSDQAERVVEGARHLSPYLGDRMLAAKLDGNSVFVRELMPQDRKIEVEQLTSKDAIAVAGFLAAVVGKAHGRQMDAGTR